MMFSKRKAKVTKFSKLSYTKVLRTHYPLGEEQHHLFKEYKPCVLDTSGKYVQTVNSYFWKVLALVQNRIQQGCVLVIS